MNILSYAGPAKFSTPPRRFVLWVLPTGEWRVSYYYRFRPELRFVDIAGLVRPVLAPIIGVIYFPLRELVYAKEATRYFGFKSVSDFLCSIACRAPWIYYSRNISTTTTSL